MADVAHELNWAGTYGYRAERIVRVASLDEARDLVASGTRIRPLGTRHSFNDIADGPGVLVDLTGLPTEVTIAPDRRSATVTAGTRYGVVAQELERNGLALHNMGSLPHISIGGRVWDWGRSPPPCRRSRCSAPTASCAPCAAATRTSTAAWSRSGRWGSPPG